MSSNNGKQFPAAAQKRRSLWPYLIVGMLAAHVAGMVVAFTITMRDKTFLVVPDYYDRAQHWDAAQAERRASAALGWKLQLEPGKAVDEHGNRAVKVTLADAQDHAIAGLKLRLEYFHHAHPDQQHKLDLTADPNDGRIFGAALPMSYSGVWEFHLTGQAGDKRFVETQTTVLETK